MSSTVYLRPEAQKDIEEAAFWYEKQRPGLGNEFLDKELATIALITETPTLFPILRKNARRALVKRFPFGLYYLNEQNRIVVFAVIHGSRHPNVWKGRT